MTTLRSTRYPWWAIAALSGFIAASVALFTYGRVFGLSYSEYSDFGTWFVGGRWYDPLSLGDVIGGYGHMTLGWYRPTSFLLVPYLLRLDYFSPGTVMAANIAGLVAVAALAPLFVSRRALAPAILGSVLVVSAPVLYLIPYGSQIDALYVLFSMGFIGAFLTLWRSSWTATVRFGLIAGGSVSYILAVTSKEIAVVSPLLLISALLLGSPRPSWARLGRATFWASPFLAVSAVLYYAIGRGDGGNAAYSRGLHWGKLTHVPDLLAWTAGFPWPSSSNANWLAVWPWQQVVLAGVLTTLLLFGAVLVSGDLGWWRIAIFGATFVGLAALIAIPGGLPHHAFPLVVLYAVAFVAVGSAVARRATALPLARWSLVGLILALAVVYALNGRARFADALYRGPQTAYFNASTELFYGSALKAVSQTPNPLLVFQDCLGGLHNPLAYYARSGHGSQIVVTTSAEVDAQAQAVSVARRQGRDVFIARCTGGTTPYYSVSHLLPIG